ncbi:hypothetical protein VUN82_10400 [Micrococcaceae bacterium Sec5.1]
MASLLLPGRGIPGKLLGSLAAMLAAGGEHASDLDILRSAPGVFGQLPSNATVSRFFERTVINPELFSYGFGTLVTSHSTGMGTGSLAESSLWPRHIESFVVSRCSR